MFTEPTLNIQDISKKYEISISQIYKLLRDYPLNPVVEHPEKRYSESDVEEWREQHPRRGKYGRGRPKTQQAKNPAKSADTPQGFYLFRVFNTAGDVLYAFQAQFLLAARVWQSGTQSADREAAPNVTSMQELLDFLRSAHSDIARVEATPVCAVEAPARSGAYMGFENSQPSRSAHEISVQVHKVARILYQLFLADTARGVLWDGTNQEELSKNTHQALQVKGFDLTQDSFSGATIVTTPRLQVLSA